MPLNDKNNKKEEYVLNLLTREKKPKAGSFLRKVKQKVAFLVDIPKNKNVRISVLLALKVN